MGMQDRIGLDTESVEAEVKKIMQALDDASNCLEKVKTATTSAITLNRSLLSLTDLLTFAGQASDSCSQVQGAINTLRRDLENVSNGMDEVSNMRV